jgi:hypothetical protein
MDREWGHKKGNSYVLACWKASWGDQDEDDNNNMKLKF